MKTRELKQRLRQESQILIPDQKSELLRKLNIEPSNPRPKRTMLIFRTSLVCSLLLFALILFGIINGRKVPANTIITIDINPSLEMEIDDNDVVQKLRPLNTDGALVLESTPELVGKNLEEVLSLLLEEITELEYLDPEDSEGQIRIFTVNSDQEKETEKNRSLLLSLGKIIDERKMKTRIDNENDKEFLKQEARKHKVSIGKMAAIARALEADSTLTIDAALKLAVSELNEIARHYSQTQIDAFYEKYRDQVQVLENKKQEIKNAAEQQIQNIKTELQEIKALGRKNGYGILLRMRIRNFITANFPDYEFNTDNISKDYLDQVIDELLTETDSLSEFIRDVVEENFKVQRKTFEQEVRKKIKDEDFNFDFQFNQEINLERLINQFKKNKNQRQIYMLLNKMTSLLDIVDKNPGLANALEQKITDLYNQYTELLANATEDIQNSELITEFAVRYQNYLNR